MIKTRVLFPTKHEALSRDNNTIRLTPESNERLKSATVGAPRSLRTRDSFRAGTNWPTMARRGREKSSRPKCAWRSRRDRFCQSVARTCSVCKQFGWSSSSDSWMRCWEELKKDLFCIIGSHEWQTYLPCGLKRSSRGGRSRPVATGGALVGLAPPYKAPSPPNWNTKYYTLVEYLSNLNVKPPPCTNVKPPSWRLSGDGSGSNSAKSSPCSSNCKRVIWRANGRVYHEKVELLYKLKFT